MSSLIKPKKNIKEKIDENYQDMEEEKRIKMLILIAEIITKAILKELYETSN